MSKLTVVNRGLRLGIRQSLRISRLKTEVLVLNVEGDNQLCGSPNAEWGLVRTDVANVTRSTEEIGFACIVIEIVDVAC